MPSDCVSNCVYFLSLINWIYVFLQVIILNKIWNVYIFGIYLPTVKYNWIKTLWLAAASITSEVPPRHSKCVIALAKNSPNTSSFSWQTVNERSISGKKKSKRRKKTISTRAAAVLYLLFYIKTTPLIIKQLNLHLKQVWYKET